MLRILLVDDEPLVLIGLQGMLEWEKLGYTVCGTARNGKLALELIEREKPDIVIADVKMPVMDGLTLARTCRERNALPAFIMLTSFEEFDYIKQAMGAGVVDYLVKLDLTPENLQTALAKAAEKVKRSVLCWANCQHRKILPRVCAAIRSVFRAVVRRAVPGRSRIGAAFAAHGAEPCKRRLPCSQLRDHRQHRPYPRPAAEAEFFLRADAGDHPAKLPALLCDRGGCHALQCAFLPDRCPVPKYRTVLRPLLERASQILYNYFTVRLLWAVGRPTGSLLGLARRCRENAHLQPLLTVEQPIQFVEVNEGDATAGKMQVVAQVQEYVKNHLSEKLTLADVAAVFNFSPNYLSQLFGKYGDSGFVEYITETRIAAAKEMLEQGDLKVYEIAEKLGYESAFYFSKVFKKVTGLSPREYQQSI